VRVCIFSAAVIIAVISGDFEGYSQSIL
jgi:hypothetical protein